MFYKYVQTQYSTPTFVQADTLQREKKESIKAISINVEPKVNIFNFSARCSTKLVGLFLKRRQCACKAELLCKFMLISCSPRKALKLFFFVFFYCRLRCLLHQLLVSSLWGLRRRYISDPLEQSYQFISIVLQFSLALGCFLVNLYLDPILLQYS